MVCKSWIKRRIKPGSSLCNACSSGDDAQNGVILVQSLKSDPYQANND
jgi:hypothetical protein